MLFPPDYPFRPDAPLLSFGASFSEEIARSVIAVVWRGDSEPPHETDVRIAASLTMLEAFHPRDHLECMMAAQGVACHVSIMDCYQRAVNPDVGDAVGIKLRSNASQLSRTFSMLLHDMERRQAKPLPRRPDEPSTGAKPPDDDSGGGDVSTGGFPAIAAQTKSPEVPDDVQTRPDGTPGSLSAYAPKAPVEVFIPREPPIMMALALRPKLWRMVNAPPDLAAAAPPVADALARAPRSGMGGPLDPGARIFTGDALAQYTSARLDPNAPLDPPRFEDDSSEIELEFVSTGGDPEAEADRAAMAAAHPEGKPIISIRYGNKIRDPETPDGS